MCIVENALEYRNPFMSCSPFAHEQRATTVKGCEAHPAADGGENLLCTPTTSVGSRSAETNCYGHCPGRWTRDRHIKEAWQCYAPTAAPTAAPSNEVPVVLVDTWDSDTLLAQFGKNDYRVCSATEPLSNCVDNPIHSFTSCDQGDMGYYDCS